MKKCKNCHEELYTTITHRKSRSDREFCSKKCYLHYWYVKNRKFSMVKCERCGYERVKNSC